MMEWSYFYDKYSEWSDSKLKSYISLLEDIDSGSELVDAVVDIENKDIKSLLVRKAMEFKVEFDQDDFERLDGEIPSLLYVHLAREGNIKFGTNEEVAQVLASIWDEEGNDALYRRALKSGIKFTQQQLEWIGKDEEETYTEQQSASNNTGCGCLGMLLGFGLLFGNGSNSNSGGHHSHSSGSSSRKRDTGRCDGDCANCPPHYGYRYGRWYYGHGHQHGCQRGGNGGASGKCYKD